MIAISSPKDLSGTLTIPGSKSHTIRACIFGALATGTSYIHNPLTSADCIAALTAIKEIGADYEMKDGLWIIHGAGTRLHLPENVIDVGNSGSVLYFLTPICATMNGWSIVTGDESIRHRPVTHLLDALQQMGCETIISRPNVNAPPIMVKGPAKSGIVVTDGILSQSITGLLIAASLLPGKTEFILRNPKETPFLTMTELWMRDLGIPINISKDFKRITVSGPMNYPAFERIMPSDWESAAFPIVAALITNSTITINKVDTSKSQGDAQIVDILKEMGADIELIEDDPERQTGHLIVRGGNKSRLPNKGVLHGIRVNCSNYPDAVPALSVAACFAEGEMVIEDIGVCRHKETDRIVIMAKELSELGAKVTETQDSLIIHGANKAAPGFSLHGGTVHGYGDHRVAMALSVLGLGLNKGTVKVHDAECCDMSFPTFYTTMNEVGCEFKTRNK